MKRWKIVKAIADLICHDPFAYDSKWKWEALPESAKDEFQRILPILKLWEEKGYLTLLEDEEYAFILHPENLPNKEVLLNLSE
jgi:hypothetical protein